MWQITLRMSLTCAYMSQKCVQSGVVFIQTPWQVVAVGPFTLHQKRPRHGWIPYRGSRGASDCVRERECGAVNSLTVCLVCCDEILSLHTLTGLAADWLTLSLVRFELHWLTDDPAASLGFLADDYACATQLYRLTGVVGQVARKRALSPKVSGRGYIGPYLPCKSGNRLYYKKRHCGSDGPTRQNKSTV